MARSSTYYQEELKKNQQPTAPVLPTTPQPNLINNLQAEAQKQETQKQNLGITQEQLDQNIKRSIEKAQYDSSLVESNRSLSSSLPYELLNTVVRMPDQGYWENSMTDWEKTKHLGGEVPRTLWNIAKAIPKEVIKAPLRVSHGILEGESRLYKAITGKESPIAYKPSYNLPVLGEVKGFGGSYDEGIEMGLSPFASAVKATGEFAGDLAITASLTEAVGAAFKPRLVTVQKPVTGQDFRPLQATQLEQIGAKPGQAKLATNEIKFGPGVQNPEISYLPLTNRAAANYAGNANNTFLKVTPAREGMAKFSVVQTRKSFADMTKDALAAKFGKSKVVEGKMGPELVVDSGLIKYNPSMLKAGLETTPGKIPSLESVLGSMGKTALVVSTAEAYQFYSPNIDEGLTFETALERTKSGNQQLYKTITEDVDRQLGYTSKSVNAIGDWSDGAENTIFNEIQKVNSYEELRYNTAIKGKVGKQKAVIPFMVNSTGADSLYLVDLKDIKIADLRGKLDELGFEFRTLAEQQDGTKVVIFDPGSQLTENITKLGETFNTDITLKKGQGEFLGGETREEGLSIYDDVINGYESVTSKQSFDEWIKNQGEMMYHGTKQGGLDNINKSGFVVTKGGMNAGNGISLTPDKNIANIFGEKGGVVDAVISKDVKLISPQEFIDTKNAIGDKRGFDTATKKAIEFYKSKGYDGVDFRQGTGHIPDAIKNEVRIWNPEKIKTKSQLEAEWDKLKTEKRIYNPQANQLPVKEKFVDPYTKARLNRKNPVTAIDKGQSMAQPSVMAKPLKGFENSLVESKQADQIIGLAADKNLPDTTIQAISKAITGKDNLYELTQNEAYDVSESIRMFSDAEIPVSDASIAIKSFTHPARYWMETAEREFKLPVYSEVFLPMETGSRVLKVYSDKWQETGRELFGEYAKPKFVEERRLINSYVEGNKSAITNNQSLTPEVKMELSRIGDSLVDIYKDLFKQIGVSSTKYFGQYAPQIRKVGGVQNLYKTDQVPKEIKPFFEFEREGSLNPLEDDALSLLDIYTRAIGKKRFLAEPVKNATIQMGKMPERLKNAVNDYVQEKLGYNDIVQEMSNRFAEKLSKNTNGFIPKDINKQTMDFFMTTSYAGALGLPRIMPLLRDGIQPLITTYPDLGPKWFGYGVKTWAKKGAQELKDKGFLVEMGVPYGAELSAESGRGFIGKTVDFYKNLNKLAMKPYGAGDARNRAITYYGVKGRFEDAWNAFNEGKIDYTQFENEIDMSGFNPTLQKVLQKKFRENTAKSLEEAQDLMTMDILDRTQFPYRKGSESRAYYGLRGKLGLQFAQWSHEYLFTLKSWAARGQWDKVIRWYGMSEAIKKSIEESTNVSAGKWVGAGPFSGFQGGPIAKMGSEFIGMMNSAATGMDEEVNKSWKDITNALKIYGGILTGVGAQKISNFYTSVKRYEEGIAQSTDPDPEKKFGIWSTNGKLIRWVDFSELLQTLMGFESKAGKEQSEVISRTKKSQIEYQMNLDKAMNHLVNGDYDKFDKVVTKNDIMMPDLSTKIKSYVIPLDQRIFERLPLPLKDKYFNAFYPIE